MALAFWVMGVICSAVGISEHGKPSELHYITMAAVFVTASIITRKIDELKNKKQ